MNPTYISHFVRIAVIFTSLPNPPEDLYNSASYINELDMFTGKNLCAASDCKLSLMFVLFSCASNLPHVVMVHGSMQGK